MTEKLRVEDPGIVRTAPARAKGGADLADALIAERGQVAGCSAVMTFAKLATAEAGMTLVN